MGAIPDSLAAALRPVTVVCGHYGAGKTNFSVNLACDLADAGASVALADLDIVNPYFRATEQRAVLEAHGVEVIAPVFAEAGTSLDVPSLTGRVVPAVQAAQEGEGLESVLIIDAGGDDAGATALGRFARYINAADYAMLYVANRYRNLVSDPQDALENLREIEAASHLRATAIANNAHLEDETTAQTIEAGRAYAQELGELAHLTVVCTTIPQNLDSPYDETLYPIRRFVKAPWEE